jgi:hypothetical protein
MGDCRQVDVGIEEVQVQLIVAVRKSKCFSADICFKKPSGIFSNALFCRNEIDVAIELICQHSNVISKDTKKIKIKRKEFESWFLIRR